MSEYRLPHIAGGPVYDVNSGRAPFVDERVQHCNERTGYAFVDHTYRPDACEECALIEEICR